MITINIDYNLFFKDSRVFLFDYVFYNLKIFLSLHFIQNYI